MIVRAVLWKPALRVHVLTVIVFYLHVDITFGHNFSLTLKDLVVISFWAKNISRARIVQAVLRKPFYVFRFLTDSVFYICCLLVAVSGLHQNTPGCYFSMSYEPLGVGLYRVFTCKYILPLEQTPCIDSFNPSRCSSCRQANVLCW